MMLDTVKEIISKQLDIEKDGITIDTDFADIGVDSLDLFKIVIDIEEVFNIRIENTDGIKSVGDLIDFIKTKKQD